MKISQSCSSPVSTFVEKSSEGAQHGDEGALKQQEIRAAQAPGGCTRSQFAQIWQLLLSPSTRISGMWKSAFSTNRKKTLTNPALQEQHLPALLLLKTEGNVTGRALGPSLLRKQLRKSSAANGSCTNVPCKYLSR